jgi:hypothetical protein
MIDGGMVYYSTQFRSFLTELLEANSYYLISGESSAPNALLPLLTVEGRFGVVANGLPFFGSHGAPVVAQGHELLAARLLHLVESRIETREWASVTIVENPLKPLSGEMISNLKFLRSIDERISQITHWEENPPEDLEDLIRRFHVKHRNAIRKGRSTGQVVEVATRADEWDFLIKEHARSIRQLGGSIKSSDVFEALRRNLGEMVRLHCGYVDGKLSAALLSLRYGKTVEYFVPVSNPDFRHLQVLPHLVSEIMLSDFGSGVQAWNWGGTWISQGGVQRFKNRFGSTNRRYRYFHWSNDDIASAPEDTLTREYPYWYTRKFV